VKKTLDRKAAFINQNQSARVQVQHRQLQAAMIGDTPMLMPPLATGSVDNDLESVGHSHHDRQPLSDRGLGGN